MFLRIGITENAQFDPHIALVRVQQQEIFVLVLHSLHLSLQFLDLSLTACAHLLILDLLVTFVCVHECLHGVQVCMQLVAFFLALQYCTLQQYLGKQVEIFGNACTYFRAHLQLGLRAHIIHKFDPVLLKVVAYVRVWTSWNDRLLHKKSLNNVSLQASLLILAWVVHMFDI